MIIYKKCVEKNITLCNYAVKFLDSVRDYKELMMLDKCPMCGKELREIKQ